MSPTPSFDLLAAKLITEHERQVGALQGEIDKLKELLGDVRPTVVMPNVNSDSLQLGQTANHSNGWSRVTAGGDEMLGFGLVNKGTTAAERNYESLYGASFGEASESMLVSSTGLTSASHGRFISCSASCAMMKDIRETHPSIVSMDDLDAVTRSLDAAPEGSRGRRISAMNSMMHLSDMNLAGSRKGGRFSSALFPALALQRSRTELKSYNGCSPLRFVQSDRFEWLAMSVIVLNTVSMCLDAQYQGYGIGHSLAVPGYSEPGEDKFPGADGVFKVAERTFVVIFTIELVLRVIVYRLAFFRKALHWLDFIVVIAGLLDWIAGHVFDPKMLRLLRFLRIIRALRTFENASFMDALYFLTTSIKTSLSTLFWSLVLLTLIQCIASLLMCQMLYSFFEDAAQSPESTEVFKYYGTFSRSFLTMFEILLANWPIPCRVLIDIVGEEYGILILIYRCVCGFAVLNVISAVFIQQTMKIMSQDTDVMLLERGRVEKSFRDNLERLFTLLDISHDGIVSKQELEAQLSLPEVHIACFNMGISVHDLEDIFHLCNIAREDGMPIKEFIQAAHHVRKQANTLDVARVLMHSRSLSIQVQHLSLASHSVEKKLSLLLAATMDMKEYFEHGANSTHEAPSNFGYNIPNHDDDAVEAAVAAAIAVAEGGAETTPGDEALIREAIIADKGPTEGAIAEQRASEEGALRTTTV